MRHAGARPSADRPRPFSHALDRIDFMAGHARPRLCRGTPSSMRQEQMLEALGNIGEFVGALGVVISLVYLARQMIQNTVSVRAASFNSMVQNSIRLLEHSFRDSEFADFLNRAQQNPDCLTPPERVRWDAYMTAVYRHFGNLQYSHRVGALDEQMWEAYRATLKEHLRTPSWANWFQQNRSIFSSALGRQVDEALAELAAEGPPDPHHEHRVSAP
jgi:hypothetical protein